APDESGALGSVGGQSCAASSRSSISSSRPALARRDLLPRKPAPRVRGRAGVVESVGSTAFRLASFRISSITAVICAQKAPDALPFLGIFTVGYSTPSLS